MKCASVVRRAGSSRAVHRMVFVAVVLLSAVLPVMGGGRSTEFVPRRAGAPCEECAKLRRALSVLKGRDLAAAKRVHAAHMKLHKNNRKGSTK